MVSLGIRDSSPEVLVITRGNEDSSLDKTVSFGVRSVSSGFAVSPGGDGGVIPLGLELDL